MNRPSDASASSTDPPVSPAGPAGSATDVARAGALRFAPKDRPLRRDVGRLGAQLGHLLRELAPAGVFERVESARIAARRRRKGRPGAERELTDILASCIPEDALEVVRAFSAYFGAVNMAEQVHRMRRRMDYLRTGELQRGSLRASAVELARRGTTLHEVRAALETLLVEPVFTAHPTESVRRTLLKKDQRLARALVERFDPERLDPVTLATLDDRIELELASAWQTEEQLPGRPTVAEEVEHVLFFLSDVLFRVVPAVHEELANALSAAFEEPVVLPRPVLRFSSWVGGDMDGNPNVGAETIRATLARHLQLALRRYREELRTLHEHLSQSESRVPVSAALRERVRAYSERFPDAAAATPERYREMPYRQLLWLMTERLERKDRKEPGRYGRPEDFRADLELLRDSLAQGRGDRAGLALVERVLLRLDVFGFHLAALDVRQDAQLHRRVVGRLLEDPGFEERPIEERAARIAAALAEPADAAVDRAAAEDDDEVQRTLDVFRALAEVREDYGSEAVGPFLISMARGPDDALAVLFLARCAGCVDAGGAVPLDVAPLFETVDDLDRGPETLRTLASQPQYAAHLASRGTSQLVMLGYSDSNKDGGFAASRVALQSAQEALASTAEELGISLTLFHGRGGSISRGGSKPRAGILAAPRGALGGHARSTEQGEVIGAKYGLRGIATRSLEVTLGALLERTAGGDPQPATSPEQRALAETLAKESRARYRSLVHDEPDFPELFRSMTPIDVIERLAIGSRPSRRRQMRGVQDLRAIPWVFAWTQCRAVLPGWFGVGSGLRAAIDEHGMQSLRQALAEWPFLATLAADVEMVLAKSDLDIARRYAALAGDVGARLFPVLEQEHAATVAVLCELRETDELLAHDPILKRSIQLRNPYVDPLSLLQVDFLQRWREGDREDDALLRVLVQTVRGIARGSAGVAQAPRSPRRPRPSGLRVAAGLDRLRQGALRLAEHLPQIDLDPTRDGRDGNIVRRSLEGVLSRAADALDRVEDPHHDDAERNAEPGEPRRDPREVRGEVSTNRVELVDQAERDQQDEDPHVEHVQGRVLTRVREVLDALGLALAVQQLLDHPLHLHVAEVVDQRAVAQLAQGGGLQAQDVERGVGEGRDLRELLGLEIAHELVFQRHAMLADLDPLAPLPVRGMLQAALPRPALAQGVPQGRQPGDVTHHGPSAQARQLFLRSRLVRELVRHEVAQLKPPLARGVHDAAPDLARLPDAAVGGVVLEAQQEGNRGADQGDRQPRQVQPAQAHDLVQDDGHEGDEREQEELATRPGDDGARRVDPLGVHARILRATPSLLQRSRENPRRLAA